LTLNSNIASKNSRKVNSDFSCGSCSNSNCLIKKNLSNLTSSVFVENKKTIKCKKGQQFIIEGAPVNGLFFILKGTVKVFRTGIQARDQIGRFANE
jgi:hypothetical protein